MLPNNSLSSTPLPAPFLPPRTAVRFSTPAGAEDQHPGGIAIADASAGLNYQLWTARARAGDITLSAPNTPEYVVLSQVSAAWVALAFDQSAQPFIGYADELGNAAYYWFDSTLPGYRTSTLVGVIRRVFAALDDARAAELGTSDVILAYEREGELYMRVQRDRFGVEYDLGACPSTLVQIGMNRLFRFQFAFRGTQPKTPDSLPPAEFDGSGA